MPSNTKSFPQIYVDIMHDLMSHATSNNAQTTIEALKNLYFLRQKVAEIDDEYRRNNEIFRVTHLEAEPGFCVGKTVKERIAEIDEKVTLLLDAYQDAKANDNLDHFFLSAFQSDACINHRLKQLKEFYSENKGKTPQKSV